MDRSRLVQNGAKIMLTQQCQLKQNQFIPQPSGLISDGENKERVVGEEDNNHNEINGEKENNNNVIEPTTYQRGQNLGGQNEQMNTTDDQPHQGGGGNVNKARIGHGVIRIPQMQQKTTTMVSTLTDDNREDQQSIPVICLATTLDLYAKTRLSKDKELELQRDSQMKQQVETYVRSTLFHKIKFISDQDDLGNLRYRTSTGHIVMDHFRVPKTLLERHRWWILYQDVVKKALEQQRANCNTYLKEVVVGKYKIDDSDCIGMCSLSLLNLLCELLK